MLYQTIGKQLASYTFKNNIDSLSTTRLVSDLFNCVAMGASISYAQSCVASVSAFFRPAEYPKGIKSKEDQSCYARLKLLDKDSELLRKIDQEAAQEGLLLQVAGEGRAQRSALDQAKLAINKYEKIEPILLFLEGYIEEGVICNVQGFKELKQKFLSNKKEIFRSVCEGKVLPLSLIVEIVQDNKINPGVRGVSQIVRRYSTKLADLVDVFSSLSLEDSIAIERMIDVLGEMNDLRLQEGSPNEAYCFGALSVLEGISDVSDNGRKHLKKLASFALFQLPSSMSHSMFDALIKVAKHLDLSGEKKRVLARTVGSFLDRGVSTTLADLSKEDLQDCLNTIRPFREEEGIQGSAAINRVLDIAKHELQFGERSANMARGAHWFRRVKCACIKTKQKFGNSIVWSSIKYTYKNSPTVAMAKDIVLAVLFTSVALSSLAPHIWFVGLGLSVLALLSLLVMLMYEVFVFKCCADELIQHANDLISNPEEVSQFELAIEVVDALSLASNQESASSRAQSAHALLNTNLTPIMPVVMGLFADIKQSLSSQEVDAEMTPPSLGAAG